MNEGTLIEEARIRGVEIVHCIPHVFEKLSYRDRPDGLIAIGVHMQMTFADFIGRLASKKHPLVVIAESIEKPGNLGTIFRLAAKPCFGIIQKIGLHRNSSRFFNNK